MFKFWGDFSSIVMKHYTYFSGQLKKKVVNDCQHVEKRQKKINDTYAQLKELALVIIFS